MGLRPIYNALGLVVVFLMQTAFLVSAWVLFVYVLKSNPLNLSDSKARLAYDYAPWIHVIVPNIATVIGILTTLCFSTAIKQVLEQRLSRKPVPLAELGAVVALAQTTLILKKTYPWQTIKTIVASALFTWLTSAWTTLLTPVQVILPVEMSGWELDLGSSNFDTNLQQALAAAVSSPEWIEVFGSSSLLSGIAAAGNSFGLQSIFNFNDAKYNVSTGGILPAVVSYSGTQQAAPLQNSGINFSGGLVPANLTASQRISGISSNYTAYQQGLTANVTCAEYTNAADWGGLEISQVSASGTLASVPLTIWGLEAACPNNGGTTQQVYVTSNLADDVGVVSSVVCPNIENVANSTLNYTFDQIMVFSNGTGLYSFLPPTVCQIVPMITTSMVVYANQIITTTVVESTPIQGWQQNLLSFLVSGINYQAWSTQSVRTNAIGDALMSIYTATTTSSITDSNTTQILQELSQFWRGVVEFSGTFVRSGFSASPRTLSSDMLVSMQGAQVVTTIGWTPVDYTYLFALVPITLTAFFTYIALLRALWLRVWYASKHEHDEFQRGKDEADIKSETNDSSDFDVTDPIHIIVASGAEGLTPAPSGSHWEKYDASNMRLEGTRLKGDRGRESDKLW
ncbi:hypothetical protein HYDPIDRAFT_27070 [Hydnomerulius pinastri MD-312]|nr:hypothetical protein HYDPIDRAFT_27070 [Hydnomerulius pinastri MD-312]